MSLDWDQLRSFLTVANCGSFTKAAERLGLSQSAVSRQIINLERSLKVALFQRHARGLSLTEAGETLFKTAEDVAHKLQTVTTRIRESTTSPSGELRVTTTLPLGTHWLTPLLPAFHDKYPDISLTLLLDDRAYDLGTREADVAIRMIAPHNDSDLIFKRLMKMPFALYAAPSYLARKGTPVKQTDLETHDLLAYPLETALPFHDVNWHLPQSHEHEHTPVLRVNSTQGLLTATRLGLGIGSLPVFLAEADPQLVPVLPHLPAPQVDVYFVYSREQKASPKILALREFLQAHVLSS